MTFWVIPVPIVSIVTINGLHPWKGLGLNAATGLGSVVIFCVTVSWLQSWVLVTISWTNTVSPSLAIVSLGGLIPVPVIIVPLVWVSVQK